MPFCDSSNESRPVTKSTSDFGNYNELDGCHGFPNRSV